MKTAKINDCITLCKVIDDRGWNPKLIPIYLTVEWNNELRETVISKSEVVKTERYLTKIGIDWRVKNETT